MYYHFGYHSTTKKNIKEENQNKMKSKQHNQKLSQPFASLQATWILFQKKSYMDTLDG